MIECINNTDDRIKSHASDVSGLNFLGLGPGSGFNFFLRAGRARAYNFLNSGGLLGPRSFKYSNELAKLEV